MYWQLAIGESMLASDCSENITCLAIGDGMSEAVYDLFELPQNAICKPGPPASVECANGYTMAENGTKCIKDKYTCTNGFEDVQGLCIRVPDTGDDIWRHHVQDCNELDGNLAVIDTATKIMSLATYMKENSISSTYIAGRVMVYLNDYGEMHLAPAIMEEESGKTQFKNYDLSAFLLHAALISDEVSKDNLPKIPLALAV